MKCVIILSAIIAVSSAGVLHSAPLLAAPALLSTGASAQFRSQDNIGNYAFGYNEDHATGGTFRRESGDAHGNKVGSYGLRDADGRLRIVNYVADAAGFRADIQTNEPGTEPKAAASTTINGAIAEAPVHAPLVAHGPIVEAAAIHAPVHHAAPLHHAPLHHGAHLAAPLHHEAHLAAPLHHGAHLAAPLHHAPAHLTHHAPLAHYSSAVSHHGALLAAPSAHHASYAAPFSYASPYGHFY